MFQKKSILIVFAAILSCSCMSLKNTATAENPTKATDSDDTAAGFTVSFISIGGGIDGNAFTELNDLFVTFQKDNICKIEKSVRAWGREGEKDVCFKIIDKKCLSKWKKTVQKKYTDNRRVFIKDEMTCKSE